MKERPILMSAPMIRALLDGRKTQTRRLVKPQPRNPWWLGYTMTRPGVALLNGPDYPDGDDDELPCPHGQPGDHLWVREAWSASRAVESLSPGQLYQEDTIIYAADGTHRGPPAARGRGRSSIHMPRWASRLTLKITDVRVQRLQEITDGDARAEGIEQHSNGAWLSKAGLCWPTPKEAFQHAWNDIYGARPGCAWAANPWVWVLTCRRVAVAQPARAAEQRTPPP